VEGEESWGQLTRMEDGNVIRTRVETVAPATYAEFYKRLAKAMKGDKDLVPVDPEQAALVIRLLELARESSRTGRTMDV
jgi:predicted dehydrogenase